MQRGIEVAEGPFEPCPTSAKEMRATPVARNDAAWYYETANYIVEVCIPVPVEKNLLMYVKGKYGDYSLLAQAKPTQHGFSCSGSAVSFEIYDITLRILKRPGSLQVEPVTKAN